MSQLKKLIGKIRNNPKNVRFTDLCKLCELIEMARRSPGTGSSHVPFKRSIPPRITITIQNVKGMAKHYQVKQVLNFIDDHNLLDGD